MFATHLIVLSGFDEDGIVEPSIRSIKYMEIDRRADQKDRRFAGTVFIAQTTNMAFETTGQVIERPLETGDPAARSDLLAGPDPGPHALQLTLAENLLAQKP